MQRPSSSKYPGGVTLSFPVRRPIVERSRIPSPLDLAAAPSPRQAKQHDVNRMEEPEEGFCPSNAEPTSTTWI